MSEEKTEIEEEVIDPGTEEEVVANPLEMSDEDFMDAPVPDFAEEAEEEPGEEADPEVEEEAEPGEEEDPEAEAEEVEDPEAEEEPAPAGEEEEEDQEEVTEEVTELDPKAEYERLLKPFKANGKEMQINNVDEALTLMKMGANYQKKMVGLKPNLKLLKMLDNNELLDEAKLSHLIDLSKKDPAAITQLIKESGINPLDINTEEAPEYRPNTYTVDDKQIALDTVLEDIQGTETYATTLDIVGTKWDESSREVLLDDPSLIGVINDHVASGVYDKINTVVERERMLGRLSGVSDIDAYKQVGETLKQAGAFNSATPAAKTVIKQPAKKPGNAPIDPSIAARKRAAGATKSAPGKKAPTDFNPLDMSDEEFEKLTANQNF